jgi:hypothetical protein
MYHLIALQAVWVIVIWTGQETWLSIYMGDKPPENALNPYEYGEFIHLKKGDELLFKNVKDGDDPYQMLMTDYPDVFRMEEGEDGNFIAAR